MSTIGELIDFLRAEMNNRGYISMPPASSNQVVEVQRMLLNQRGAKLPEEYYAFLGAMDGGVVSELSIGGTESRSIHYTDGRPHRRGLETESLIDLLDGFHEDNAVFFVPVMRGGGWFYGWDQSLQAWQIISYVGGGKGRTYRNFEECLADALDMTSRDVRRFMPTDFAFTHLDDGGNRKYGTRGSND